MKKVLLDTNAYTALLANNQDVFKTVAKADVVYLSIFVIGELMTGFKGGKRLSENRNILLKFLRKPTVKILNTSLDTGEIFGHVKNLLMKAGTPIPTNDVWISAHTIETGSTIITFDKHFNSVPGLLIWPELDVN